MRIVFYLIWLMLLAVLQPTLGHGIQLFGVGPNLFMGFVVLVGLYRGRTEGALCGAVFGLIYDILIGRMIGISCLCMFYLGFGAGVLGTHFFVGAKRIAAMAAIAIGTLLYALVYEAALLIAQVDYGFLTAMVRIALPEALYSAVIGFFLSFPVLGSMKLFKMEQIS